MARQAATRKLCLFDGDRSVAGISEDFTVWTRSVGATKRRWQVENGGDDEWFLALAISPDGKTVATDHADCSIRLRDAKTGKQRAKLEGHEHDVPGCVAFSPDGATLASGGRGDGTVRVWAHAKRAEIACFEIPRFTNVFDIGYSHDGKLLAAALFDIGKGKTSVVVWDLASGKRVHDLTGHRDIIWRIAWSPVRAMIASASTDKTARVVALDGAKPAVKVLKGHTKIVRDVQFTPDGTRVVTGSNDHTVRAWDVATGKLLLTHDVGAEVTSLSMFGIGTAVLVGLQTGELRRVEL